MSTTEQDTAVVRPFLMEITETVPELGFTVVAVSYSHHVEFTVYDVVSMGDEPWWPRKSAMSSMDITNVLAEAKVYLHGSVKWDGCSNWHFDEQDRVMLHCCTRDDLLRLGNVLAWCWDKTAMMCPSWDSAIAQPKGGVSL